MPRNPDKIKLPAYWTVDKADERGWALRRDLGHGWHARITTPDAPSGPKTLDDACNVALYDENGATWWERSGDVVRRAIETIDFHFRERPSRDPQTLGTLRAELSSARHVIRSLIPEAVERLIPSLWTVKTAGHAFFWQHRLEKQLLEYSRTAPSPKVISNAGTGPLITLEERSYCPLCGGSSQQDEGYKWPKGLQTHFEESCEVFEQLRFDCLQRVHEHEEKGRTVTPAPYLAKRK